MNESFVNEDDSKGGLRRVRIDDGEKGDKNKDGESERKLLSNIFVEERERKKVYRV